MKYTKRFLALFLALCMMLTSVPLNVNATEGTPSEVATEAPAQDDDQTVTEEETSEIVDSENTESTEKDEEDSETVTSDEDVVIGADQSDSITDKDSQDTTLDDAKPKKDKPDNAKPGKDKKEDLKPGKDKKEDVKPGKDKKTKEEDAQESVTMTSVPERSTEDTLSAALAAAKKYIDALTINNASNDPATVVSNYGKHFTWDNEKRENSKPYLYDWSYYNGVVFEGLEYVYDETEEEVYGDYVEEYMSSLIASNGTWAKCTNNSSKECAGYDATHGADCYKTASLLLDMYERTNDSRYLTIAETLYTDLDNAAKTYSLSKAGNNYRHTWSSDSTPDLWLDGLYMILPFCAEYAKYIGDTEELDLIVDRMQWVSDNMYNESKGLFYHAADSATSNSGSYWLRAIGWYAAAIVDVMDSMEGENLEAMKKQLVKLVDGMKACQNASNGMWLNNMAISQSSTNPYETSGTALVCYAVMKAVNEGWLDASYADMAILAFEGICNEKLNGENLTDICFKGAPGSGNSTFYDNEGKGVGPFIMLYAEVMEYVNDQAEEEIPEEPPVEPEIPEVTVEETTIKVENVTNLTGTAVTEEDKAVIAEKTYTNFVAYDITAEITEGAKAIVSIPVPAEWNATEEELIGISVEDGEVKEIKGKLSEDGIYSFEVEHFSAKGVAYNAKAAGETPVYSGTGKLVGGKVYTLDTNGVTANKNYLIVNTGSNSGYALTNNNGTVERTAVTIIDSKITVEDDTNIAWQFSGAESGTVGNNGRYVYPNNNSLSLNENGTNLTISRQNNGVYRISRSSSSGRFPTTYYVRYSGNSWTGGTRGIERNIYLYELTSSSDGKLVEFAITPESTVTLAPKETYELKGTVTVAGETVDLSNCAIEWSSTNTAVATVDENGKVTAEKDGTTSIKATLSEVNGTALQENIVLTIPVTVESKKVVSATLSGNTPVTTKQNVEPDFSNIKLEVTYEDGGTATITVENGLKIEGYDIKEIGYTYAKISYAGTEYGEVRVTVEGNPYEGLDEAAEYPEYPTDGAVRIDKTATHNAEEFNNTGVTHVELDVAGISVKKGTNVIMISDISNSMSWDDSKYDYNDTAVTTGTNQRLNISKASAKSFVKELLADNSGAANDNTFTLLAFAGIDGDYNTHSTASANDDVYQVDALGMTSIIEAEAAIDKLVKATTGGTNYDYAFQQAYSLAQQLYDANGKEVYIVFMTDGVPTHYNGVYYKSRDNTDLTAMMQYVDPTTGQETYYTSTGNDRNGNDIDATAKQNITVYYNDGTTANKNVTYNKGWSDYVTGNLNGWAEKVKALDYVSAVYSIGFGMKNGSVTQGATSAMPTLNNVNGGTYYIPSSTTQTLLKHIATNDSSYFEADNEKELSALYASLATQIKFAGTSAQVTDTIGSKFTLQMANYSGSGDKTASLEENPPSITVKAYDLYTKADDAKDEVGNDLTGSRTGTFDVMECVSFNEEGTKAYSDQIGEDNIMETSTDGTVTINAFYFTYTKTPEGVESFKWTIGNITDKEVVLGFDAYLKGALEGDAPKGTYYTNENAVLEYIDINGQYAKQTFEVPHINWGGATTTIRFYLVNENGEPVNRAGTVIPWANRIYVGEPINVNLNLNADMTIPAQTIEAAAHVPPEYFLYDYNASYTLQTASGEVVTGGIIVSEPSEDAGKTTYDKNGNKVTQKGDAQTTRVIEAENKYYTWSIVGFGVRYDLSSEKITPLNPETIVMDYGKDIQVNVLANDSDVVPKDWTAEVVGFVKYNANTDVKYIQANRGSETYTTEYGKFSIVDGNLNSVNFEPTKMLSAVQKVFCVVKFTEQANTENYHYRYNVLNIIPATSVYYETTNDKGNKLFGISTTETEWSKATVENDIVSDGPQNDGTIGQNLYGFDSTYANDKYLSNGSSLKAIGKGVKVTTAEFSFTGTAFDLISRTGTAQGAIRVDIYSDAAKTNRVKSITVLNKSESDLELYQIPVVSAEMGTYGTYYVTVGVNAAYENTTYPELSRGGEFFFDAIRVYNPVSSDDPDYSMVMSAYMADGEANMERKEVRAMLIKSEGEILGSIEEDENGEEVEVEGIVFVDRLHEAGEDGTVAETGVGLAKYQTIGPNNEVYLTGSQTIGLGISVDPNNLPTSIDIGAKSVHGEVAYLHATVWVGDAEDPKVELEQEIASGTAQNYDLLDGNSIAEVLEGEAVLYVMIDNLGEGILSITDLKIAYGNGTSTARIFANEKVLEKTIQYAEGPSDVVSCDVLNAEFTKESIKRNAKASLVVTTDETVESLGITNKVGKDQSFDVLSVENVDGKKTWTVQYKITSTGTQSYTIVGYDKAGNSGATTTASIKVTR